MRRRGYTPGAIREFCDRVGISKVESESDPALLEWCVREELNKTALRRMAVLDPVKVVIDNWDGPARDVELPNNPVDPEQGVRKIPFGREIWIERADFMEVPEKKFFRMTPGGEVRLRGACIFKCTGCIKNDAGEIVEIHGTWDDESWGGNAADGRKVKGTIHFVDAKTAVPIRIRKYNYLLNEDGTKNEETIELIDALAEPSVLEAQPAERFQFFRHGYYVADSKLFTKETPIFNEIVGLKSGWKK
jgi:glutaminyl-tRNA synthetase